MVLFPPAVQIQVAAAFPVTEPSSVPLFTVVCFSFLTESKQAATSKDAESEQSDDFTMLKSLADDQKTKEVPEGPAKKGDHQYVPDESDSTKSRRLADDYDSTKNGMDYGKYQGTRTLDMHFTLILLSLSSIKKQEGALPIKTMLHFVSTSL